MEESWVKRYAYIIKAALILIMIVVLLVPLAMTEAMIRERSYRQEEAIREVSGKWGQAQTVTGPVLVVPYKKGNAVNYAYFLPEELNVDGDLVSENRQRGIYNIAVYNSNIKLNGRFKPLSTEGLSLGADTLSLNDAFLAVGITDLRGINKELKASWDGRDIKFIPGLPNSEVLSSGIHAKMSLQPDDSGHTFSLNLALRGSEQFSCSPLGANTKVSVRSNWRTPSFDGAVLPETHSIGKDSGFVAKWETLGIGRTFPQEWTGNNIKINSSDITVKLFPAIDTYQQSLRSVKYSVLIIGLTFLLFYFIELLQGRAVHPLQYMLIGLALCIFYTLLIAISEQLNFTIAYAIAATMTVGLITFYLSSVFKNTRTGLVIGGALGGLYAFLYVIIRSEDQALLMGSIGLFVTLAVVMFISRRIRWEKLSAPTISQ
ncbi:cell envelope integrity protein CreD [Chitinophaga horti]|uniref:Cell envelope integrity protein CreD n=1 Tax=Chitinophaga horti TaxID=2920382 RepID=A0ABY6J0N1_9BACT|nr:cell envelope integrity protein CreD [Chitinophaga horti]UYQ93103.1 cell envelope integrity protein CreD [Chitinophaga horti]